MSIEASDVSIDAFIGLIESSNGSIWATCWPIWHLAGQYGSWVILCAPPPGQYAIRIVNRGVFISSVGNLWGR